MMTDRERIIDAFLCLTAFDAESFHEQEIGQELQARLTELGYYAGTIDGSYGLDTQAAIADFQSRHGLSADGVAGRQTQDMLDSYSAQRKYVTVDSASQQSGYQLLKPETISLMCTEQLPTVAAKPDFLCPAGPDYGYGLGVRTRVRMDGGENSGYGEFGWDGAAGCFELADPENGVSIAFVTHVLGWPSIRNEFHIPIRNSVYEALKA